ncbi:IS1595 family transposase [Candidatus Uhrbacteria bacterium]|nr:IS1595 family transposase [Candidatus Uhrbacteria bacterium]
MEAFVRSGTANGIREDCPMSYRTAHKVTDAIRKAVSADVPGLLCGTCEADETYVGGSWRNRAVHIRRRGTKRGRGTSKQPIFGLIQREDADLSDTPSQVRVWLTPDTKNRSLVPVIRRTVCRGSTIYTGGRKGYRRLPAHGYIHDWVDHGAGEYVRGDVHTQNMDGYWGQLKTSLDSIGGIRRDRSHLFMGEHAWRFNFRHLTRKEKVERIYKLLTKIGGR